MRKLHNIAVLGGGSFGTVIANIMANNGHTVCLWLRNQQRADEINQQHINSAYLPDYPLNPALKASTDLAESVTACDVVFMSVPSSSSRDVARELSSHIEANTLLISTTKGIEPDQFKLMSEVLAEEVPQARVGVLSGPNLAKEIASGQITATVIASHDNELNETVQALLHSGTFRVYASSDVFGVELGGALKNVYAIIAGMAAALGTGENTISMLLTRSLAEMSRFAVQKGADPMTFLGLSGVGDLIATCMSPLSRNYRVGFQLGEGKNLDEIVSELGQVAEGVNTLKLLKQESEGLGVYMPLVSGLYDVIYNKKTIDEVVGGMMFAEQNRDVEFTVGKSD
jgi:glycerol-3-phosphate dehydrogenase (NAD(P)+)